MAHAKKTLVISLAALAVAAGRIYWEGTLSATLERFPEDLDRKIGRKVVWEMTKEALAGKYNHIDDNDEEASNAEYDKIFMRKYTVRKILG